MTAAADNEAMASKFRERWRERFAREHPDVEPGLLRIFRWYVAIRLGLGVLAWWSVSSGQDPENPRFPGGGVLLFGLLAILLFWPRAQQKLGKWFLPVALVLATLGPIVESTQNILGRLDAGLTPNDALADYWLPFFLLWVPLLMIAWQYRFRAVLIWAAATTFLDAGAAIPPLEEAGADVRILSALVLARGVLWAFVGFFVVKLVGGQKEARASLADHAATREALATSRERNRLARELHDTLAHSLSATAVQLEAVKALWDSDPEKAKEMLDQSLAAARGGLGEARRAIQALRASPLEERGLLGALDELGAAVEARSSISVATYLDKQVGNLDPQLEQAVYRIADEALTNVVRHSNASEAQLSLARRNGKIELQVRDNGAGFDSTEAAPDGHVGLQGMRERAELVGGSLLVDSDDGGTKIRFEVEATS